MLNKDIIKGKWHEIKGRIKKEWELLTDSDLAQIEGSYEELQGLLQKKYGYQEEEAKEDLDTFIEQNKWDA